MEIKITGNIDEFKPGTFSKLVEKDDIQIKIDDFEHLFVLNSQAFNVSLGNIQTVELFFVSKENN